MWKIYEEWRSTATKMFTDENVSVHQEALILNHAYDRVREEMTIFEEKYSDFNEGDRVIFYGQQAYITHIEKGYVDESVDRVKRPFMDISYMHEGFVQKVTLHTNELCQIAKYCG